MTTVTYSFEGGSNGANVAAGSGAGTGDTNFDAIFNTSATNIYDNAHAAHGTLANKIATAATSTSSYVSWTTSIGTQTTVWIRTYLFFTAAPAVQHRVVNFVGAAASRGNVLATTAGKLIFTNSGGGTVLTSLAFPTNAWFRLEAMFTGSATVGQWEYKIWYTPDSAGTPDDTQTSAANLNTGGTVDTYRFGFGSAVANAGPYWQDDVGVSTAAYIGPVPGAPANVPGRVPPVVVARRSAARGWFAALAAPANASPTAAIAGKVPPHILVRRRRGARAWWRGTVTSTVNAVPQPGTVPPHVVVARRTAARALWAGFVSRTVNVFPVAFQVARSVASVAATAPSVPVTLQVTAAQAGSTQNGLLLRVVVLTSAAAAQNGASAAAGAGSVAVTTTQAGSRVYGAALRGSAAANSPVAGCALIDDVQDGVHGLDYSTWKTAAPTVTPGAATVGCSFGLAVAALEVLAAGTLTEDASGPAAASATSATAVATASFTPPAGSLLVALVSSDGAGSVTAMTVSGGGLPWAEQVRQNPAGNGYVGVWTAALAPARASSSAAVAAPNTSASGVS